MNEGNNQILVIDFYVHFNRQLIKVHTFFLALKACTVWEERKKKSFRFLPINFFLFLSSNA